MNSATNLTELDGNVLDGSRIFTSLQIAAPDSRAGAFESFDLLILNRTISSGRRR